MFQSLFKIKKYIKPILYFIGLSFIGLTWWTSKFFGDVTVEQALFTFKFGMKGALGADPAFYQRLVKCVLIAPIILTIILMGIEKFTLSLGRTGFDARVQKRKNAFSILWRPFEKIFWLIVRIFNFIFKIKLHFILPIIGIFCVGHQFSVISYVRQFSKIEVDYFKPNFVDPHAIKFYAHHPKNLVLIYVESLEATYSDKKIFGRDLLQGLNHFKSQGISFENYLQVNGTGWTIAGIVSTQCGIPLKLITMLGQNGQGEVFNTFLPKAKCLGDILAENGYTNVFLNGPELNFAGVGTFFKNHHYTEMYGKDEWIAQGMKRENMSKWGLYDDDLFAQAKIKLASLIQSKKLFNLTILTIDTHGLSGYLSKTCKNQGYHNFEGIVECTANQITDFVNYVSQHGWLDQLNIVILGDHLVQQNELSGKIELNKNRNIYNLIITDQRFHKNTNTIVHFDMFPTILNSIGFNFKGGRLGLGYSAISQAGSAKPADRIPTMISEIGNYSETYNKLW